MPPNVLRVRFRELAEMPVIAKANGREGESYQDEFTGQISSGLILTPADSGYCAAVVNVWS